MKNLPLFILLMAAMGLSNAQQSGSTVMHIYANGKNPDFNVSTANRTVPQTIAVRCSTTFLRSGETLVLRLRKARVPNLDSAKVVGTISIRKNHEWAEFPAKLVKGEYYWVDAVSGPLNRVTGALNTSGRAGETETDLIWHVGQDIWEREEFSTITAKGNFTDDMDARDEVRLRIRSARVLNLDSAKVVGEVLLNKNQREAAFPSKIREGHFYWIDVVSSKVDYTVNPLEVNTSAIFNPTYNLLNIKTHKRTLDLTPPTNLPALPTVLPVNNTPPQGIAKDLDGNIYRTISIGNLIWFQENLRTTQYNDTTPIRMIMDDVAWRDAQVGAYCLYENKPENESMFGKLYNGYAVATGKLCPLGWRVPTDEDWKDLERSIGLPAEELNRTGGRGSQGDKLKTTNQWQTSSYVNSNETGFSALPAGARMSNGDFKVKDQYADFWTSTVYDNPYSLYLWNRHLYYNSHELGRMYMSANNGFSCRCVKDK